MRTKITLSILFIVTIIALISCLYAYVDNNNKWKAFNSPLDNYVESTIKADSLNYTTQLANLKFIDSLNSKK